MLTHDAAVDRRGVRTLDVLEELGASISLILTAEHGLRGVEQAEIPVTEPQSSASSTSSEVPVVSLYGTTKESLMPTGEHLSGIDVLVVDLVDVGARYYTYVWTALLAARAAVQAGSHVMVLDRPNPLSGDPSSVEGASQKPGFLSLVGLEPTPIRHALTVGEMLALFLEQDGQPLGPEGALTIVGAAGWERCRTALAWGRPFIPPSPNMPSLETALVYPGACLVEGTNLSEGRGTTLPFRMVGAPFLDGTRLAKDLYAYGVPGALVRPVAFRPGFDKHQGQVCEGVMIHVTEPFLFRPVATYLALIALARQQAPERFEFLTRRYEFETDRLAFDLLSGSSDTRQALINNEPVETVVAMVAPAEPSWQEVVKAAEARALRAADQR